MEAAITFHLMKLGEVERVCAIKKSQIYKLIQERKFPPPVSLGPRARAWKSNEIQDWIEARPVPENFTNGVKAGVA